MTEEIREINGVELCTESFGSPSDPCILLIMGATASMVWWDREFCGRLADTGRFVIRYDNRDVGRSICYPPGGIRYTVHDLAEDAFGVLDSYGIERAHFVGMSLGGMIAQVAALKRPGRVASITAVASGIWDDRPDLPPIDEKIYAYHARAAETDWRNGKSVLDYMVGAGKLLGGPGRRFDEGRARVLAREEVRRARSLPSMFNHVLLKGAEELYGKAGALRVPTLVIHGTEDPVLPLPHARALYEAVPGARLVILEGAGHELHKDDWEKVISNIAAHTASK